MNQSLASMEFRGDSHPAVDRLERELAQAKALYTENLHAQSLVHDHQMQEIVPKFIQQFARHVGGDGEFWLHELEDFFEKWKYVK